VTGYIEAIDYDALVATACRHDLLLCPVRRPGDFVSAGWTLLEAHGSGPVSKQVSVACSDVVTIGRQRTAQQDLRYAIDELVEIATRALSPGVNDPFTAIGCIDWLGAALAELDRQPVPPSEMRDPGGTVRVILRPLRFEDYLAAAFGQLRTYCAADPNARAHALATLEELAAHAVDARHRAYVEAEIARLRGPRAGENA
jgi:uncharacterized membrane protein